MADRELATPRPSASGCETAGMEFGTLLCADRAGRSLPIAAVLFAGAFGLLDAARRGGPLDRSTASRPPAARRRTRRPGGWSARQEIRQLVQARHDRQMARGEAAASTSRPRSAGCSSSRPSRPATSQRLGVARGDAPARDRPQRAPRAPGASRRSTWRPRSSVSSGTPAPDRPARAPAADRRFTPTLGLGLRRTEGQQFRGLPWRRSRCRRP